MSAFRFRSVYFKWYRSLFSVRFDTPKLAGDSDEAAGFAFTLPADPAWAGRLASITLSGPGGTATLDRSTDRPAAIARDPLTGRVRAILRDLPRDRAAGGGAATLAETVAASLGAEPDLEVLTSRGLPDPSGWPR